MRYLEGTIRPERGYFHEFDERVRAAPEIAAEAIHQLNLLGDDTVVLLYELSGETAEVDALLDAHFEAITYQTSNVGQNRLVYAHIEPSEMVRELLEIPRRCGIVLEYPLVFRDEGALQVTLVGAEAALQEAMAALSERVQMTVDRIGTYAPESERLFVELTDRQQEVLLTAIEAGYYDVPRTGTYADVAARVGLSEATVGEHLRKIESAVLRDITASHRRQPAYH